MSLFDNKYNENLEKINHYLKNGRIIKESDNIGGTFGEVLILLIWGDIVTNVVKYGVILSGILGILTYTIRDTDYMVYIAIAVVCVGLICTWIAACIASKYSKNKMDEFLLLKPAMRKKHMKNFMADIDVNKVSSKYLIFNGCSNNNFNDYLKSRINLIYSSTSDIKQIVFNKNDRYGISDFLEIPNIRRMHIIRKRKNMLDEYWKEWITSSYLGEVIDLTQMYNDLYMFIVYDIIATGGKELTKKQKIRMTKYILEALGVDNIISVDNHVKNLENNEEYISYMKNCFYITEHNAGAFWQLLCYRRDYNGGLIYTNIRFLEEFQKFYVQLIIFLFDMHLYNANTFTSIGNIMILYYYLSKDIDENNLDNAKEKKNLVNVLAPIEIDMEEYVKHIQH